MAELNNGKIIVDWAPVQGIWRQEPEAITFLGVEESSGSNRIIVPQGIALSSEKFINGRVATNITLPENPKDNAAHILLGFSSWESRCLFVGLSGTGPAYVLLEHLPGIGWREIAKSGAGANLKGNCPYRVELALDGHRLTFYVNGIKVLDQILSGPLGREQLGLHALGEGPISFNQVEAVGQPYSAFVVMQFTEQFNDLYDDVIRPVCEGLEIDAYRASDIYRPGAILQDILQGLDESYVVIADVTPPNPNVFYELGYSHALKKPVILLAERNTTLPFDISGYRVIFYDNTIGGKSAVEADLRRHLNNILGE